MTGIYLKRWKLNLLTLKYTIALEKADIAEHWL